MGLSCDAFCHAEGPAAPLDFEKFYSLQLVIHVHTTRFPSQLIAHTNHKVPVLALLILMSSSLILENPCMLLCPLAYSIPMHGHVLSLLSRSRMHETKSKWIARSKHDGVIWVKV